MKGADAWKHSGPVYKSICILKGCGDCIKIHPYRNIKINKFSKDPFFIKIGYKKSNKRTLHAPNECVIVTQKNSQKPRRKKYILTM